MTGRLTTVSVGPTSSTSSLSRRHVHLRAPWPSARFSQRTGTLCIVAALQAQWLSDERQPRARLKLNRMIPLARRMPSAVVT